ncbi:MAG: DedA family protein [Myxococcota bacterium]|jgi:membrane protein DedA with SNARE-associated domain|nr:DedA family protein [Myxococcota bacterium]
MTPDDPGIWRAWIEAAGAPGVVLCGATNAVLGQPPAWLVLGIVGWLTLEGAISLPVAVGCWAVGYTIGSSAVFAALARYGRGGLDRVLTRLGRSPAMFDRANRWFGRWGGWAVLVARVVPGVGWMITVPAALARMRWVPFALATLFGSALFGLGMILLARELGDRFTREAEAFQRGWPPLVIGGVVVVASAWWILRRRRIARSSTAPRKSHEERRVEIE